MPERLSIEEAKDFWFGADLTVYADLGPNHTVIALPALEVIRGTVYLEKLKTCTTYEMAENLYEQFKKDPNAPKLIPRIINPFSDFEHIEILFSEYLNDLGIPEEEHLNYVDQEMGLRASMDEIYKGDWLPHEYDDNYRELAEHIVRTKVPFIWNESPAYFDDNGLFAGCRDAERWTDNWMPREISTEIGQPDSGYGIDYYEAEFVYRNIEDFQNIWDKYGFKVIAFDDKFKKLYLN